MNFFSIGEEAYAFSRLTYPETLVLDHLELTKTKAANDLAILLDLIND